MGRIRGRIRLNRGTSNPQPLPVGHPILAFGQDCPPPAPSPGNCCMAIICHSLFVFNEKGMDLGEKFEFGWAPFKRWATY
jgi:hypothetical protein